MHILLTNDDGYDAPGLRALYEAVRGLDDVRITIIAPSVAQSGKSHAVSDDLYCRRGTAPGLGQVTIVDGTPADCVRMAVTLPDASKPDWVIAGINRGGNLGMDVYYSGTTAAAREAAIIGVQAMAVSQVVRTDVPDDWPGTTARAAAVIAALVQPDLPAPSAADQRVHAEVLEAIRSEPTRLAGFWWNVNLPIATDRISIGARLAPLCTNPLPLDYQQEAGPDGSLHLQYAGNYHARIAMPGSDVAVAFGDAIAITPVSLAT